MVGDAIIAAKHGRGDQAKQLLGSFVECAILVSLRVQRKEPFDPEVVAAKQLFIHFRAVSVEFIHLRSPFARIDRELGNDPL
jgi:hypothetical protein